MTDSCTQGHERNGDVLTSDDDSLSLLCGLNVCQSRGAAEDMAIGDLDSQVGNNEQKNEMEMDINRPKTLQPGISSCNQSAASCANSSSKSANVLRCVKIPNKMQLNKRNGKGETILHTACKRKDLARVKVLIQAGISINTADYAGWTSLHEASAVGDEAVVEELLKAGANVNARSFDGVTPLHDAAFSGHYQVVKLLLQHGSNTSDRNVGGLSALEMAQEESIKELLLTSVTRKQPCEAPAQHRQPGETPPRTQLSCQGSVCPSHNDTANVQSRESGDRDRAKELGDIQLRKMDTAAANLSHPEIITVLLEEVGRKQTEISTWQLAGPEDAGRYRAALAQIQNMLSEVVAKQHLEKDNLAQKYRSVCDYLLQRVLKSRLVSLALCQRNLVETLQKQMHLAEVYVTMKAKLSTLPANPHEAHGCDQESQRRQSLRPVSQASRFRLAPPNNAKVPRPPDPFPTQGKKAPTHTGVLNKRASCQSGAPQPGNTLQHISFQMKGSDALIQRSSGDNNRNLSKLIQRGVMPTGSPVQLWLKGHWHLAHVLGDGSIRDGKGKVHLAPERWLESVLGNNIPVSVAYAWDKVTFRDKPLSYYISDLEAERNTRPTRPEDSVQHCWATFQEALTTEAASLNHLMKITRIYLVDNEELLPNAMMDRCWEELLKKESEDWGRELL